jgi:succinate-semialdehyde dehydrogenase/glutarate-semialdehyde dehydrogenase
MNRLKGLTMSSAQAKAIPDQDNRESIDAVNPATGEVYTQYYMHTKEEAEQIIEEAHEAFLDWRNKEVAHRAEIILQIGKAIEDKKDYLAEEMTKQMGKPIAQSYQELELCKAICEYTADNAVEELKDEYREFSKGQGIISYEPVGVILSFQPWNFPLYQVVRYSVANIVAGNTTVLRHAQSVWGFAAEIEKMYVEAGLPEGVFKVIYLDNEEADQLIAHDKVRGVTMTGSAAAGKIVAEIAGKHLKKTVLELGGSDPYLVLDDVEDLDDVVQTCVEGRINNGGQTCVAAKRFIVHENLYDEFKEKYVKAMENTKFGDPMDKDNKMGPLVGEEQRDKLHKQVQECIDKGATCLTGGEIPDMDGFYYPPTVLENIKPGMPAYDDELFGPVAALFKVSNEQEAIKLANDHRYGLGGGVFSSDEKRAENVARQIDTGMVSVNGYFIAQPELPFGGVKESGYGREHGGFGMKEFVNIKSIMKGTK